MKVELYMWDSGRGGCGKQENRPPGGPGGRSGELLET
jgi:hypothetical protein